MKLFGSLCLLAGAIALLVSYLLFNFPGFNAKLNSLVYDAWLRANARPPENSQIVVVDIDEASLGKIGQLPWPRTILSDLITILLGQGVKAIDLDIWLTEPDRSSPIAVDNLLEKNFGLNLDFTRLPPSVLEHDRYFRDTISGRPVVLGSYAIFEDKNISAPTGQGAGFPPSTHPIARQAI